MGSHGARLLRVLLVEDDAVHAELFQECLDVSEDARFTVRVVRDVRSAIAALAEQPDVVVTDLGLPDATGLCAVDRLLEAAPQVPLVVATSRDDIETCMRAIEAGAQDYIVKGRHAPEFYGRMLLQAVERKLLFEALRLRTQEIETFSYALTHDLKSPLRILRFMTDRLREHEVQSHEAGPDREALATFERMDRTLRQMDEFIQEILLFARLGAGLDEMGPVDLHAVVEESVQAVRPLAERLRADVKVESPPGPVLTTGDARQLRHLLVNLIENGIVHGREDLSEVRVRVATDPADGGRVALVVEDNGPGVPVEERTRIFEPFHRASSGRPEAGPGHGMGLALVERIARNHKARVEVREAASGGARFVVSFRPLAATKDRVPGAGARAVP